MFQFIIIGVTAFALVKTSTGHHESPNIIWIFADDMGYNDLGIRNPDVITPNLDHFATEGVQLTNHYVQQICSPSRSAFLSGRYPSHTAMQHVVLLPFNHWCLPLKYKLLPQYLKELGYSTHAVGKWHIGHCRWECTPLYRGFDTFSGAYDGAGDYIKHTTNNRYDWVDGMEANFSASGIHSQDLVLDRALRVIDQSDSSPFFLYLAFHNPHSPLQPKDEFLSLYDDLDVPDKRKKYLGLMSGMDSVIGQIMDKLKLSGLAENTIVVFSSDNGGDPGEGDNTPYRGGKSSLFEGGTKSASFVWSPLLEKSGITNDGMMHVTDWLPTLVNIAGGNAAKDGLDGLDQSDMILRGGPSVRTNMIYNLDREYELFGGNQYGEMAVRIGDYKLIWGMPGHTDGYGSEMNYIFAFQYYQDYVAGLERRRKRGGPYFFEPEEQHIIDTFMHSVQVTDEQLKQGDGYMQLFNLKVDPYETTNLVNSPDDKDKEALQELIKMIQCEIKKKYQDVGPSWGINSPGYTADGVMRPGWCNDTVLLPTDEERNDQANDHGDGCAHDQRNRRSMS